MVAALRNWMDREWMQIDFRERIVYMSVYKPARDRATKGSAYRIQFYDHNGRRRTTKGCPDKEVSRQKAAMLQTLVEQIKLGLAHPNDLERALGKTITGELEQMASDFGNSLAAKENTKKHNAQTLKRIRSSLVDCGIVSISDLGDPKLEIKLCNYFAKKEFGSRTINHYLQALSSFATWLMKQKLLIHNPFACIPRRNPQLDVRRKRRALSSRDIRLLIKTAYASHRIVQGYAGATRGLLYTMAAFTGLRRRELASLTPHSFNLDSKPPTLTVEATASKHRKPDQLPLHESLIPIIRLAIEGLGSGETLFLGLARKKTYSMIVSDLKEAEIDYQTQDGYADFHCLRHTYITNLATSGIPLVVVKELARHSDIRMTMKYTHVGLEDQDKAVNQLPKLDLPTPPTSDPGANDCLHNVCTDGGPQGQSGASGVTHGHQPVAAKKRKNPCKTKGFNADWQPVSPGGNNQQKLEAAGIEPSGDFDVSRDGPCDCENCQQCRAAYVMHRERFKSHFLASLDCDLQQLMMR